jgi:transposase
VAPSNKSARRLGAHLVFADESGFLLIPTVRRTWAPRGQTPHLRHSYRHDRLSAISISPRRRRVNLYFQIHDHNLRRREVCRFVSHLLRHLRDPIFLLWDNIAIHRGGPLEKLRRRDPRLRLVPFPAYAPELNPDEGVWRICKAQLANGQPEHLDRLWGDLFLTLEDLRDSPSKLRGCIRQSDLPPFLF